jgi:curved DNA-binding protein CbpA
MSTSNYYDILDILPDASLTQIKEAYIYKVNILHPDRLQLMTERIRVKAEEELKVVNAAYAILSNPEKRRQYDLKLFGGSVRSTQGSKREIKPYIEVYPTFIKFNNCLPYVKQNSAFFVRNKGGHFNKIMISKAPEWITDLKTTALQENSKFPMAVKIEAMGIKWGQTYSSQIKVRLDESEASVEIELHMQKKPHKFLLW